MATASDAISAREFHESDGVADWRVLLNAAHSRFRTKSFAAGVELIQAIGILADAANHHPDVDLRYSTVAVRLTSHDVGDLSLRDVDLARRISAAARDLGIEAEPGAVQALEVAIDALVGAEVQPFWRAVLGFVEGRDELPVAPIDDPYAQSPGFWFQQMDAPRTQRNRIHIDVTVPHDQAEKRVAAALQAGGHMVSDQRAPAFWVLADAEGNEACVSTWLGRD